jgi:hypothetical protein
MGSVDLQLSVFELLSARDAVPFILLSDAIGDRG